MAYTRSSSEGAGGGGSSLVMASSGRREGGGARGRRGGGKGGGGSGREVSFQRWLEDRQAAVQKVGVVFVIFLKEHECLCI